MTFAYIGLGGNDIRARRHLSRAARLIRDMPGIRFVAESAAYCSAPLGCPGRQRDYCNGALKLQTLLPPIRVFRRLQKVERLIQRRRRRRNAPRRTDVDYLAHGAARLRRAALTLPHPRMHLRAFVLTPLADVAGARYEGLPAASRLRAAYEKCRRQRLHQLSPNLR